jgi:two-component system, chemotaxis family, protein-glutamate methylesterase/glutaminase
MAKRDIIVIGASAGGFEALKELTYRLPDDLQASIFIVWHISPFTTGILPQILNKGTSLNAANAVDGEPIEKGRIYVAPPDHHLLIEKDHVRVTRGPKENRFRPAVDPLFRSAAYSYGSRVIGVVLSGSLDDGTAGLWTIKHRGGKAVVQDPADAEVPAMPMNAIREVDIDACVPISEMADVLVKLTSEEAKTSEGNQEENGLTAIEIRIAAEDNALEGGIMNFGKPTPYTCPECHGVLFQIKDGNRARFRCHTGHAFSADTLLASVTESIEESMWNAIRGIEESIILLNHLGKHFAESDQPNLAALYFKKAHEAQDRADLIREAVMNHEHLSKDSMDQQAGENGHDPDGQNKLSQTNN